MYKVYLDESGNFLTKVSVYKDKTPLHVKYYKVDIDVLEDALIALGVEYIKGILEVEGSEHLISFDIETDIKELTVALDYIEIQLHVFLTEYFMDTYGRSKLYYMDKLTALIACKLLPVFQFKEAKEFDQLVAHIIEYEKRNPIDSKERTEYKPYRKVIITPLFNVKFEFPKDERNEEQG